MKRIISSLLVVLCSFAVSAQKKDTLCINMQGINSVYDDYQPHVPGNKALLFTSNRKNTQETQTVEFSEKVYFTIEKRKSKKGGKSKWTAPEKNGYTWNSDNNTALIAISPSHYYFYRCYWLDNGEIFTAKRIADRKNPWRASSLSRLTRISSDYDECSIAPLGGDSMLFVSNRNGNYDIFLQTGYQTRPVPELNTPSIENDLYFRPDTRTLYFSSNRADGVGGFDIYESVMHNGQFSPPRLLLDTVINTPADDRDFRKYNDSLMYLSSNRDGGMGGFDLYMIQVTTEPPLEPIVIELEDEYAPKDSIVDLRKQLYDKLKDLGLIPFRGEVQVGAYRYIKSLKAFEEKFPCITKENIRMDTILVDGVTVHKFIIDTVYNDVDKAINKQLSIEAMHCLPDKVFADMPFIGMLDQKGNRYAIFWKKDDYANRNVFYIFKNGKQVWKNKLF
ncbi:MAG: hypothetical protein LBR81_08040 [Prevotellaceae bacterium]|jgi:hypothetical protein|nr:hypothetical protein [Prevotellaceae bacterium]